MSRLRRARVPSYRLKHEDVTGAIIQALNPDEWDLNRMLPEEHALASHSTVTYTYACHYLKLSTQRVLIDAGFESVEVVGALAELGIEPAMIDLVLITHGDVDHIGGLLTTDDALTYPNAQYVLHQELWEHWHDGNALAAMPEENRAHITQLVRLLADRVDTFTAETEITPEIRAIPALGHRHGHSAYEFSTTGAPILHFGDALFHPLFAEHSDWPDSMALDPEREVASRQRLLTRAAKSSALVLTGHIPFPGIGYIHARHDQFEWEATFHDQRRSRESDCWRHRSIVHPRRHHRRHHPHPAQ